MQSIIYETRASGMLESGRNIYVMPYSPNVYEKYAFEI